MRVWARRERADAARVDNLVWTTALNLARNRLRWHALWRFADPATAEVNADRGLGPAEISERDEDASRLRQALRQLPGAMRQVLLLSEFGGLGAREIAGILGIPPGTVGSRKHQALARLRVLLKEDHHD